MRRERNCGDSISSLELKGKLLRWSGTQYGEKTWGVSGGRSWLMTWQNDG